jgi:hypothetical protein
MEQHGKKLNFTPLFANLHLSKNAGDKSSTFVTPSTLSTLRACEILSIYWREAEQVHSQILIRSMIHHLCASPMMHRHY